jgi:hypothetical protein
MIRMNRTGGVTVFLAIALLFVNVEASMAIGRTITLFSDVSGRLVDRTGTPQAGVRIERSWQRSPDDEVETDETITDRQGIFSFPAATGRSLFAEVLPGTPVIRQEMTAFGPNGPVTLWKTVKTNFDLNGELDGRSLFLECRIDTEPNGDGPIWGTCREVSRSSAAFAATGGERLQLTWQWPAGRPVEVRLLVHLEKVQPARRGFLGLGNSPSLAGSMPDPHELVGVVMHGPQMLLGSRVNLWVPGTETAGLVVGEIATLGIVGDGNICVCVSPGSHGCSSKPVE